MGVAGLWELLRPAAKTRSLTDIAIREGFEANPNGKRGFRLGIDASIWFFHAEYGREGENPVLRTLFFRCATLMRTTFLPIFVFDGPKRPDVKRGKKINRSGHKLIPGMKQIVEAFGFEWRMAPGEAEAELAYLNRIGVIDGILSDDVDNFLFGATTVIRNSSNTLSGNRAHPALNAVGKDDKNHSRVFRIEDITNHPDIRLTRGGMILIGLMSGGDYHQAGVDRCGPATAHGLAKCGFGDSLYEAARALDCQDLPEFLVAWRHELRQELRTNSKGLLGRKQVALANSIPESFPDIDILLSYVNPITSESMGRDSNNTRLTWSKEPDLAKLAEACEFYFEWGYKEAIIKRFRTIMWPPIVLRILRRAVLDLDDTPSPRSILLSTPHKSSQAANVCGTPSKMIAKHFSSSPSKSQRHADTGSDSDEDEYRLITRIHSMRMHTSTDGILEYRIEIVPKQLVHLTASGIKGIRAPEGPDEWASEEEDEEGATKKRGKGKPVDPEEHLRLWMPACLVKLVEPTLVQQFEDIQEEKRLKKLKKGSRPAAGSHKPVKNRKTKAKPDTDSEDVLSMPDRKLKKPTKKLQKAAKRLPVVDISDEGDGSSADELPEHILLDLPKAKEGVLSPVQSGTEISSNDPFVSSASARTGIRDLTKKKSQTSLGLEKDSNDLKSFFTVTQKASSKHPKGSVLAGTSRILSALGQTESSTSKIRHESKESNDEESIFFSLKVPSPSKSPSKRKANAKASTSNSERKSQQRLHKSPRKRADHTSPKATQRRPSSPSPSSSRLPARGRIFTQVIDILTDSETDEPSPKAKDTTLPAPPVRSLPPLMAARERFKAKNASTTNLSSKIVQPLQKNPKRNIPWLSSDIIDLT
ncbi:hypothetical protein CPB84DRAFT_1680152 [Gymnopilus junonius]|uniref:XPG-I domain-containing protein n=1 Tax=Gymnopilus junonius TaxID=109634 RepID=A0A9P5TMH4_GYMJU|nr:hypothetical protein CPB84DRAFT_1680152 [Gymnopilus junonius]